MAAPRLIKTLLLLALPASGKSEVRRYLGWLDDNKRREDLHLGRPVHLDDYPYVHIMRRIDAELNRLGRDPVFFATPDGLMIDARDWGTLVELINEDYAAVRRGGEDVEPPSAAAWLFSRLDGARSTAGAGPALADLAGDVRAALGDALEAEAARLFADRKREGTGELEGTTVVIEFARGGPRGTPSPLPAPLGYAYSLARLSDEILSESSILYVWVTPEESRRRNEARARPGPAGEASILFHGVPRPVMLEAFGMDDFGWLLHAGGDQNTVAVQARGKTFHLPAVRFDNRRDQTSFLRDDPEDWPAPALASLHEELHRALTELVESP